MKIDDIDSEELYYASEAAEVLKVTPGTVKAWFRSGKIAGVQFEKNGWIRIYGREIIRVFKERQGDYISPRCPNCKGVLKGGNGNMMILTCTVCGKDYVLKE